MYAKMGQAALGHHGEQEVLSLPVAQDIEKRFLWKFDGTHLLHFAFALLLVLEMLHFSLVMSCIQGLQIRTQRVRAVFVLASV